VFNIQLGDRTGHTRASGLIFAITNILRRVPTIAKGKAHPCGNKGRRPESFCQRRCRQHIGASFIAGVTNESVALHIGHDQMRRHRNRRHGGPASGAGDGRRWLCDDQCSHRCCVLGRRAAHHGTRTLNKSFLKGPSLGGFLGRQIWRPGLDLNQDQERCPAPCVDSHSATGPGSSLGAGDGMATLVGLKGKRRPSGAV
jgi:hypothetical protein